jgi:hypothetical protein
MATTSRIVFRAAPLDCGLSGLPFQAWPMYLRTRKRGATWCVTDRHTGHRLAGCKLGTGVGQAQGTHL